MKTDLLKSIDYTAGNVHDSQVFEDLLTGSEDACYADKAYASDKHEKSCWKKKLSKAVFSTRLSITSH
jgi:IS5 family transposase